MTNYNMMMLTTRIMWFVTQPTEHVEDGGGGDDEGGKVHVSFLYPLSSFTPLGSCNRLVQIGKRENGDLEATFVVTLICVRNVIW